MPKELNQVQVNLQFTADTAKAKQQLKDLQKTLTDLVNNPAGNSLQLTGEIAKASQAAAELSVHLRQATNMKTGTLDFSKLNQSIQKSGTSIQQLGSELLKLGPEGQQAFSQLATAISKSEIPMLRMGNLVKQFSTTLANTLRWQMASGAIHALSGAMSTAYNYAKDLNRSLNDIRIVTGQNIDQMDKFAERANRAAKALSASTLDYTNASLIYYQQGLSDQEVQARTDVTVKMANVTGETAEQVSQQLTAVWNNFAKGADNLEYYADVMTALGAATASSSDEIAQGLEKFAAVADTVGLSYEYATAALATITATTRQSADIVGTALKTLFARLEGLKLGETLDDGTDLNKYSQALANVGVSIKTASGELKEMDTILDETAVKWKTLTKDQQVALAQSVAGVRQYTQFITLMSNWDFMQQNVEIARNSMGTLQEQQDIYADSWQAAADRVKAAFEQIYTSIIDDDFFITMLNFLENVTTGVGNLIKAIGGLPGLLSLISALVLKIGSSAISSGLTNLTYNLSMLTKSGQAAMAQQKTNVLNGMEETLYNEVTMGDPDKEAQFAGLRERIVLQSEYNAKVSELSPLEQEISKQLLDQVEAARQRYTTALENEKASKEELDVLREMDVYEHRNISQTRAINNYEYQITELRALSQAQEELSLAQSKGSVSTQKLVEVCNRFTLGLDKNKISVETVTKALQGKRQATERDIDASERIIQGNIRLAGSEEEQALQIAQIIAIFERLRNATENTCNSYADFISLIKAASNTFSEHKMHMMTWQETVVTAAGALSSTAFFIMELKGAIDVLNNTDMSIGEKFTSLTMAIGIGIPMVLSALGSWKKALLSTILVQEQHNIATLTNVELTKESATATLVDMLVEKKYIREKEKESIVTALNNALAEKRKRLNQANVTLTTEEIIAIVAKTHAENIENLTLKEQIVLLGGVIKKQFIAHAATLGLVAAIGVLITVLVVLAKKMYEATPEGQLKRAQKAGEDLTKQLEEVKQKTDDLKSSWDALQSAQKTLSNLKRGTQEWNEVLLDSNQKVLDLLEKFPALQKYLHSDNGRLYIDQQGYDEIYQQSVEHQQALAGSKLSNNLIIASREAELKKTKEADPYKSFDALLAMVDESKREEVRSAVLSGHNSQQILSNTEWFAPGLGNNQNLADIIIEYQKQASIANVDIIDKKVQSATTAFADQISNIVLSNNDIVNKASENDQLLYNQLYSKQIKENLPDQSTWTSEFKDENGFNLEGKKLREYYAEQMDVTIDDIKEISDSALKETLNYQKYIKTLNSDLETSLTPMTNIIDKLNSVENNSTLKAILSNDQNTFKQLVKSGEDTSIKGIFDLLQNTDTEILEAFFGNADLGTIQVKAIEIHNNINQSLFTSLDSLQEKIKNLNSAFKSLKQGDTIDPDKYLELSDTAKIYFQEMEDGTYKLIGDAKQFKETLFQDQVSGFLDNINYYNDIKSRRYKHDLSDEQQQDYNANVINAALTSDSLGQLETVMQELRELNVDTLLLYEAENAALIDLGSKYESCADNIKRFELALQTANTELRETEKLSLMQAIQSEELASSLGLDARDIEDQAKAFRKYNQELAESQATEKSLTKRTITMAAKSQSMNKGIEKLSKNWDDWNKILQTTNKTTPEYIDTIQELEDVLKNLIGLSDESADLIPDDFFDDTEKGKEHLDLMAEAAKGNTTAIALLGVEVANLAAQDILSRIMPEDSFNTSETRIQRLTEGFSALYSRIQSGAAVTNQSIATLMGMTDQQLVDALNAMSQANNWSEQQLNDYIRSFNGALQADVKMVPVTQISQIPIYETTERDVSDHIDQFVGLKRTRTSTKIVDYQAIPEKRIFAEIQYGKEADGPAITYATPVSVSPGSLNTDNSGGGGGGGGSTPQKKTKSDVVERYKEINDKLEDYERELSRVKKLEDQLYGKNKLDNLKEQNRLLDIQIQLLQEKAGEEWNKVYQSEDFAHLNDLATNNGINNFAWQFETEGPYKGNIKNYTEVMLNLLGDYNAAVDANNVELAEKLATLMDDIEAAAKSYEDEIKIAQELEDSIFDSQTEKKQNNYKSLETKIELRLDIREKDLQFVENKIRLLGDDFFKRAEVFALMADKMGFYNKSTGQMAIDQGQYRELKTDLENLDKAFENHDILESDYIEGLNGVIEHSQAAFDALMDWNEEMKTYYSDTLSEMADGLSYFTNQIDHLNDKLEHYKKLMSLWGREQDYRGMDAILRGQLNNREEYRKIAEQNYSVLKGQYDSIYASYIAETNPEAKKRIFEAELKPITEALKEAESTLWDAQEAFAEAAQAIYENLKEEAFHIAELSLTAGQGFDALNEKMDLASKYQDEYLTKTNQIYETNKLLRDINNDINDSNNLIAKSKLKSFADEIQAMQEQGELSQLDLKIAQARYEVLKAEIALEDQKNAKSVVRLQRDNEGNFGYVYTADQNNIGKAEQDLADKTNDLYNLVLENSNNYAQKMVELRQSTLEQLQALDQNADDYEQRRQEILQRSYELYRSYTEQYGTALYWLNETAATDTFEAWTSEFIDPATYSLDNFTSTFNTYTGTMSTIYQDFKNTLADDQMVNDALNDITRQVSETDVALAILTGQTHDYMDAAASVLDDIQNETDAWAQQYETIMNLAQAYLEMGQAAQAAIAQAAGDVGYQSTIDYSREMAIEYLSTGQVSDRTKQYRNTKINEKNWSNKVKSNNEILEILKKSSPEEIAQYIAGTKSFTTGGYTGEWGNDGKLAFLHEKELVLNADDTKNFLSGIQILRQITSAIDLQAQTAGLSSSMSSPFFGTNSSVLEQEVHITAEFPNATNRTEIEEAFNNLVNRAAQYANRG